MTTMPKRNLIPTDTNDIVKVLAGDSQMLSFNRNDEEITDVTGVGHGQVQMYTSGATVVIKIFDATSGAWRTLTAS